MSNDVFWKLWLTQDFTSLLLFMRGFFFNVCILYYLSWIWVRKPLNDKKVGTVSRKRFPCFNTLKALCCESQGSRSYMLSWLEYKKVTHEIAQLYPHDGASCMLNRISPNYLLFVRVKLSIRIQQMQPSRRLGDGVKTEFALLKYWSEATNPGRNKNFPDCSWQKNEQCHIRQWRMTVWWFLKRLANDTAEETVPLSREGREVLKILSSKSRQQIWVRLGVRKRCLW